MTTKDFITKAIEGGWKYDKADLEALAKHTWHVTDRGYLLTTINYKRVKMHHFLLGKPPEGRQVDHINRNRLDNRRKNLRFVTSQQNHFNTVAKGYRKRGSKWDAQIQVGGKQIHLGTFATEQQAKKAYLQAKKQYHVI